MPRPAQKGCFFQCRKCTGSPGLLKGDELLWLNWFCNAALPLTSPPGELAPHVRVCGSRKKVFRHQQHYEAAVSAMCDNESSEGTPTPEVSNRYATRPKLTMYLCRTGSKVYQLWTGATNKMIGSYAFEVVSTKAYLGQHLRS